MIARHVCPVAAIALVALLAACQAIPPPPANMPPRLAESERRGVPGIEYSDVIEASGTPTVAQASLKRGEVLIAIPFRYRHTAVLTEEVKGFSLLVRALRVPVGAPGYYAGTFILSGPAAGSAQGASLELWCFLPKLAGGNRDSLCLLRGAGSQAIIAPTPQNPYLWRDIMPDVRDVNLASTPIFERKPIDIPVNLTLEYRFEKASANSLEVSEFAGGQRVRTFNIPTDSTDRAQLQTIAGRLEVSRVDSETVAVRFEAAK